MTLLSANFFLSSVESKAFSDVRDCRIAGEVIEALYPREDESLDDASSEGTEGVGRSVRS